MGQTQSFQSMHPEARQLYDELIRDPTEEERTYHFYLDYLTHTPYSEIKKSKLGIALLLKYPPTWLIYSNDPEFFQEILTKIPNYAVHQPRKNQQIQRVMRFFREHCQI